MPRVTHVKSARKAKEQYGIEVGDSYYWWKFRNGPKVCSKTYPRPWDLTRSEFTRSVLMLQDDMQKASEISEDSISEVCDRIIEIQDQCQESLDNMPENLQYSPTAELLQERIDAMENWADSLQNIEIPEEADQLEAEWEDYQDRLMAAIAELQDSDPGI